MKPRSLAFLVVLASACAQDPLAEARRLFHEGRGEDALVLLAEETRRHPDDRVVRSDYHRLRDLLVAQWLTQAETARASAQLDVAESLYRRVQKHDPSQPRARAGLAQLDADRRHLALVAAAEKLAKEEKFRDAMDTVRLVLAENPEQRDARRLMRLLEERTAKPALAALRLKPTSTKPISLDLRDVTLRALFDVLTRATGVSFVFDRDVRADQRATLAVRDQEFDDVVRLVLMTNQLESRLINETTLLVFPNTPQKLREYQELVVKSFYLANADVKQTANMIRQLVKTRDVFIDEKLNLLVVKDTPGAVRLAERLIAAQDLAEPEVMLEVEVLEIGYNRLLELGLRFPSSLGVSLVGGGTAATAPNGAQAISGGTPGVISLPEFLQGGSSLVRLAVTDPLFILTLRQTDGTTNVLANPRIRVRNREKARVHIGDRVPVITTTAAATGGFVSESVSYLDVGLKLEVEPLIYLEEEVGIKVGLEVSNITREVRSSTSNTLTYQIGTRNAATTLRLKDGETQVLAGLISDEDRRTASRVPGLGELPVLGRIFSSTSDNRNKTEVILLITPRLVRTLARPGVSSLEFAAGTEAQTGAPGAAAPAFVPPAPVPEKPAAAPIVPPAAVPPQNVPPAPGADMVPFGGMKPPAQ